MELSERVERFLAALGALEQRFVRASVAPATFFVALITATLIVVVGTHATWAWLRAASSLQLAVLTLGMGLMIGAIALMLALLRDQLLILVSSAWPLGSFGPVREALNDWQGWRYDDADAAIGRMDTNPWPVREDELADSLSATQVRSDPRAPSVKGQRKLLQRIRRLSSSSSNAKVARLRDDLLDWYVATGDETPAREALVEFDRLAQEYGGAGNATFAVQRGFVVRNGRVTLRPTALGNVLESSAFHPWALYGVEGAVFWPHLQPLLAETHLQQIAHARVQLDVWIALATVTLLFGVIAALAGPCIWTVWWPWYGLGVAAFAGAYMAYRAAVRAALALGDLTRACWDLHHGQLLTSLDPDGALASAPLRSAQRQRWTTVTRLAAFGQQPPDSDGG